MTKCAVLRWRGRRNRRGRARLEGRKIGFLKDCSIADDTRGLNVISEEASAKDDAFGVLVVETRTDCGLCCAMEVPAAVPWLRQEARASVVFYPTFCAAGC